MTIIIIIIIKSLLMYDNFLCPIHDDPGELSAAVWDCVCSYQPLPVAIVLSYTETLNFPTKLMTKYRSLPQPLPLPSVCQHQLRLHAIWFHSNITIIISSHR